MYKNTLLKGERLSVVFQDPKEKETLASAREAMNKLEAILPKAAGVKLDDLDEVVQNAQTAFLVFSGTLAACGMERGHHPGNMPVPPL